LLSGRYEVEREIGAGGMATVYLARDLRHDCRVALKLLRPELASVLGPERFLSEIKVTANLQLPEAGLRAAPSGVRAAVPGRGERALAKLDARRESSAPGAERARALLPRGGWAAHGGDGTDRSWHLNGRKPRTSGRSAHRIS
jgi:serine/threonine protein kinase